MSNMMTNVIQLIRREVNDARVSLIGALAVSACVLGLVHATMSIDTAAASTAALSVGVLITIWTMCFAADLFVGDLTSGRMRSKALLPVRAAELWRAKVAFLVLATSALAVWNVGLAYALQWTLCDANSIAMLTSELRAVLPALPYLIVFAALGVLSSLVAESALVAMCLALIASAGVVGVGMLWERACRDRGVTWSPFEWTIESIVAAGVILALGMLAFVRGQRRLGLLRVRVRVVAGFGLALVVVGGIGAATELYRRAAASLEDRTTTFEAASSSPDGRFLALEVQAGGTRGGSAPRSVWTLDLVTGRRELAAPSALLVRDRITWQPMGWIDDDSYRVERMNETDRHDAMPLVRVTDSGSCLSRAEWSAKPRVIPTWCRVSDVGVGDLYGDELTVQWIDRDLRWSTKLESSSAGLGRAVMLSPHPGRILFIREGALVMFDMDGDDERQLVLHGVERVEPSPDGSAILVKDGDSMRALSAVDGSELHEPWSRKITWPQWVEGSSRCLRLSEIGRGGREFVLDLDTGAQFELRTNRTHNLLHRLPHGGYVFVDQGDDVIRVDRHGKRIATLVNR